MPRSKRKSSERLITIDVFARDMKTLRNTFSLMPKAWDDAWNMKTKSCSVSMSYEGWDEFLDALDGVLAEEENEEEIEKYEVLNDLFERVEESILSEPAGSKKSLVIKSDDSHNLTPGSLLAALAHMIEGVSDDPNDPVFPCEECFGGPLRDVLLSQPTLDESFKRKIRDPNALFSATEMREFLRFLSGKIDDSPEVVKARLPAVGSKHVRVFDDPFEGDALGSALKKLGGGKKAGGSKKQAKSKKKT